MNERRGGDGTDLISELLRAEFDGQPIPDDVIVGMIALVLIAGLDTTWSASGSMLLHLATHPDRHAPPRRRTSPRCRTRSRRCCGRSHR